MAKLLLSVTALAFLLFPDPVSALSSTFNALLNKSYTQGRNTILENGFVPVNFRKSKPDICGNQGESSAGDNNENLCQHFPELISCIGMGPEHDKCFLAFRGHNGHYLAVTTYGWDGGAQGMTIIKMSWASLKDIQP
jgi:hypothetical protein